MTQVRQWWRVLAYAALKGFQGFAGIYTLRSWTFGLLGRMITQVAFFASIGTLLGSTQQVEFLLVGNAVMVAANGALTVVQTTSGERRTGTLVLLVASPTSPVLAIMGGTSWFIANGLLTSIGSLVIVAPMFGVAIPWARLPELLALLVLVTGSMYMAGTFIGGVVMRFPSIQRSTFNISRLVVMALCGVSIPRSFYPDPVRHLADVLPLTHGLEAIRAVFHDGPASYILAQAALEAAVGAGWLALALLTFTRMADAGRRNGSIVFAGG
ncbi:MAG: ABC transporter permease [Acidimicrobiales bacterium]